MRTDVEILLELKHMDQCATVRALEPEALWHVFAPVKTAQARFAKNAHEIKMLLSVTGCRSGNPVARKLAGRMHDDNPLLKELCGVIHLLDCYFTAKN